MRCEDVECPDGVERGAYGDEGGGGHRGSGQRKDGWHNSAIIHKPLPQPGGDPRPPRLPRVISAHATRRAGHRCCPSPTLPALSRSPSPAMPPQPQPQRDSDGFLMPARPPKRTQLRPANSLPTTADIYAAKHGIPLDVQMALQNVGRRGRESEFPCAQAKANH